jgi:hypothetical protein
MSATMPSHVRKRVEKRETIDGLFIGVIIESIFEKHMYQSKLRLSS